MTDKDPSDDAATFEETLDRLRQVVGQLEGGSEEGDALPLERSLALFEEGVGLAKSAAGEPEPSTRGRRRTASGSGDGGAAKGAAPPRAASP